MGRRKQSRAEPLGAPVPPPDPRPFVPHITLPANRDSQFLALHAGVVGFGMHWLNDQHYAHRRDPEWCQGCRCGLSIRWEGFVGVLSLNTLNRYIMRIPAAAFRNSGIFRERSDSGTLTGLVFTGFRFGQHKAKTNPAVIEVVTTSFPTPAPRPFPLLAALARYWNMDNLADVDHVQRPEQIEEALREKHEAWRQHVADQARKGKGGRP